MKIPIIILSFVFIGGCAGSRPSNFTYVYEAEQTGLDTLIPINGYYTAQFGCDSSFYSVFMFYPDGLFRIATTTDISAELIDCFSSDNNSVLCRYIVWGTYKAEGNIIRTQSLRMGGYPFVIFRDYEIRPDRSVVNISDFVEPENTKLAYLNNYPSYRYNKCPVPARFYPLKHKRDSGDCPLVKRKWFGNK
jgi:hypothetical protein